MASLKGVLRRALPGLSALARRVGPPAAARPLPATGRLLLLQLQQVGDSVIVSPLLRALRARYPDLVIDILTTPIGAAVHRASPHLRRQHVVRGAWLPVLRAVRAERYDCVMACVNQVSFRYGVIARATGAPRRIGFDVDGGGLLYTDRLPVPAGVDYLRANLALAAAVDAEVGPPVEEFWHDAADAASIEDALGARNVAPGTTLAVLHPASNWQSKTWYADRWAAVADHLRDREGLLPVFVGSAADAPLIDEIRALMRGGSTSLAGATTLTSLAALMARSELCVVTDSGPRHIAGALGRPVVTIMSSLDRPERWVLDRPQEIVLRTDPPCAGCLRMTCSHRLCMELVSVERVLDACGALLRRQTRSFSFR